MRFPPAPAAPRSAEDVPSSRGKWAQEVTSGGVVAGPSSSGQHQEAFQKGAGRTAEPGPLGDPGARRVTRLQTWSQACDRCPCAHLWKEAGREVRMRSPGDLGAGYTVRSGSGTSMPMRMGLPLSEAGIGCGDTELQLTW